MAQVSTTDFETLESWGWTGDRSATQIRRVAEDRILVGVIEQDSWAEEPVLDSSVGEIHFLEGRRNRKHYYYPASKIGLNSHGGIYGPDGEILNADFPHVSYERFEARYRVEALLRPRPGWFIEGPAEEGYETIQELVNAAYGGDWEDCYASYDETVAIKIWREFWVESIWLRQRNAEVIPLEYADSELSVMGDREIARTILRDEQCPPALFVRDGACRLPSQEVRDWITGFCEEWTLWARGEVYDVSVVEWTPEGEGDTLDSCGGYFGLEYAEEELEKMLEASE